MPSHYSSTWEQGKGSHFRRYLGKSKFGRSLSPGVAQSVHLQTPILIPSLEQQLGLCKQLWWDGKTPHWADSTQLHPGTIALRFCWQAFCLLKHSPEQHGGRGECKQDLCHPPPRQYYPTSTSTTVNSPGTVSPREGMADWKDGMDLPVVSSLSEARRGAPSFPIATAVSWHPPSVKILCEIKFTAKKSLKE